MANIRYTQFSGLLNAGASDFNKDANELSAMKNCYEYEVGKLEKVPGYEKASSSQLVDNYPINSLHHFVLIDNNSVENPNKRYLIGQAMTSSTNWKLMYMAPDLGTPVTTWTDITGSADGTTGNLYSRITFANYLGKVFMSSYGVTTAGLTSWGKRSTITTTSLAFNDSEGEDSDLSSMPYCKYLIVYKDLLYCLHATDSGGNKLYKNRAYYCTTPVNFSIDWETTTNFIEFGYDDGDEIMGGIVAQDKLVVYKKQSMWKYDEDSVRKIADIGCDADRSIVDMFGVPYWFNRYGIWRWGGEQPQLISNKVQKFIDAIDQSTFYNLVGVKHQFEYRLFVGNVTIDGTTYTNCWICFDTRREKFYIRCTYHTCKSVCNFIVSGKERAYFGDDDGYVYRFNTKIDKVYGDDSNEIDSFFITNNLDFGAPEAIKHSYHMTVFSKNPQGMVMSIDEDNADQFDKGRNSVLNKHVEEFDFSSSAHRYRFKFAEKSSNKSWELEGFVIETDIKEEK